MGPFFGVGLFAWTSLITVTLVALASGYALGGWLADREATRDRLYALLAAAGLATLGASWLKEPLLRLCLPLGLRAGSLVAAAVLFGPCLLLLGCVSPYVMRLATPDTARLGRTVGLVSACSTVGSFVGTLTTGFVLIGHLATSRIFALAGGLLLGLAAGHFAFSRRRAVAASLLAPVLLSPGPRALVDKVMANGTRVTEVMRHEGFYGTIQVLDYSYGATRTRELSIDGLVQGGVDTADGLPIYEYTYYLEFLPWGLRPDGGACLVVGVGAGLVPAWYEARGVRTDVVDIDAAVLAVARTYFGYRPAGGVFVEDARTFLARPGRRYDYIVIDAFTGDTTPGHLLTLEALRLVRARLAPGGLVAANLAASLGRETLMTASIVRTFEAVFPSVALHPTFDPGAGERFGNVVVLASDAPPPPFKPERVRFAVHGYARQAVERWLLGTYRFPPGTPALLLTDDFNPIEVRDAWLKERVRREVLRVTDIDLLL